MAKSRCPTHPGTIIRDDVLPALKMSERTAARRLKTRLADLKKILAGECPIDAAWALRFGKFFGNGPAFWIDMQNAYDLWHARERIGPELDLIPNHQP